VETICFIGSMYFEDMMIFNAFYSAKTLSIRIGLARTPTARMARGSAS
jgi:hypothetical protein